MRLKLAILPIALLATPAVAQPQSDPIQIPPELTDPATMARVGDTVGALSHALMDMPVGEIQAAIEGRPATPADRRRTVRDVASRGDPNFEANLQRQIAQSQVTMQASIRAMSAAMPAISRAVSQAAEEIERATANLPQPGYPKH
jgi:hypothetical protein